MNTKESKDKEWKGGIILCGGRRREWGEQQTETRVKQDSRDKQQITASQWG